MVDLALMRDVANNLYLPMVAQEYGGEGEKAIRKLMDALHKIYQHLEPDMLTTQIVVFKTINDQDRPISGTAHQISNPSHLLGKISGAIAIQVLDSEQLLLWNEIQPDITALAQVAVVYTYFGSVEYFFAKQQKKQVMKVEATQSSIFSIQTFTELRDALEHYALYSARNSSCLILSAIWSDNKRIFIKSRQEEVMRDSLAQFLENRLRGDKEVRPEQIMDTSHPVDIKVTWRNCNRLAILEIKWLGKSKSDDGGSFSSKYTEHRANAGARQLAEYLDWNKQQAPGHITRGYLVIFDIRRKATTLNTTEINSANGKHYSNKEIEFSPKYHETRDDFDPPVRMFLEPLCN